MQLPGIMGFPLSSAIPSPLLFPHNNGKELWEWGAGGVSGPELADGGDIDPGYDGRIVRVNSLHLDPNEEAQNHLHLPAGHPPQRQRRST